MRTPTKPTFYRFSQFTSENTNRDFQIHTRWTDGEGEIGDVLAKAHECGLAEIAFTEHARHTSDYYPEFFNEIDTLSQAYGELSVFRGFEVKLTDTVGSLDVSDKMRNCTDIILASVHGLPQASGSPAPAREFPEKEANQIEFDLAMGLIQHGTAEVLSHAGGMSLRTFGRFPASLFDELISEISGKDIAFEINSSYHSNSLEVLLPLLEKYDPYVSLGSDVHKVSSMGDCRDLVQEALNL
jgi:putative hydrolase